MKKNGFWAILGLQLIPHIWMVLPVARWGSGFKRDRLRLAGQSQNGLRWEVEMRFPPFQLKLSIAELTEDREKHILYLYVQQHVRHTWFYEHGSSTVSYAWVYVWGGGWMCIYGYEQQSGVNRVGSTCDPHHIIN